MWNIFIVQRNGIGLSLSPLGETPKPSSCLQMYLAPWVVRDFSEIDCFRDNSYHLNNEASQGSVFSRKNYMQLTLHAI